MRVWIFDLCYAVQKFNLQVLAYESIVHLMQ